MRIVLPSRIGYTHRTNGHLHRKHPLYAHMDPSFPSTHARTGQFGLLTRHTGTISPSLYLTVAHCRLSGKNDLHKSEQMVYRFRGSDRILKSRMYRIRGCQHPFASREFVAARTHSHLVYANYCDTMIQT